MLAILYTAFKKIPMWPGKAFKYSHNTAAVNNKHHGLAAVLIPDDFHKGLAAALLEHRHVFAARYVIPAMGL